MTTMAQATDDFAVRQRLDTFKLGGAMPAPSGPRSGHRHQRSHSRNTSITSLSSMSLSSMSSSRSSGMNDLSGFTFGGLNSSASSGSGASGNSSLASSTSSAATNSALPSSKRNSHHRRKSSVSTRRESAELMGVSLPDLPATSEYGDKDSIRRRALWALEGKQDVAFAKVEIPELSTPDADKLMLEFSSKLGLAGAAPSSGFGNSLMANKRDSFKLLASSGSSKDQLHTLHEEEEEEEEDHISQKQAEEASPAVMPADESNKVSPCEDFAAPSPSIAITKPAPSRPRPATLNLRPLSLVPDTTVVQGLPTPSLSPTRRGGLRSLSLSTSDDSPPDAKQTRRDSVNFLTNARRAAFGARNTSVDSTSSDDGSKPSRRSSIGYKTSGGANFNAAGLPTPEMTPTFSRRTSLSEFGQPGDDEFFLGAPQQSSQKPLSASEQHFLLKSHKTLVARITDLERALSRRASMGGYSSTSRPSSIVSDITAISESGSLSSVAGEPNDEMLAFIRDLKAERDELKKDVEGWRTRVNDLDRKHALLAKRVETERWEAWSARSRAGLLETEKAGLEKRIEDLDKSFAELESDKASLQAANRELQLLNDDKTKRIQELEEELERVKNELKKERESHQHKVLAIRSTSMDSDLLATPTPQTFLAQSPPSTASAHLGLGLADDDEAPLFGFTSNVLSEAYTEEYTDEDDDSGLAGYEDEDDYDEASLSFGSGNDSFGRSTQDIYSDEEDDYYDEEDVLDSYAEVTPTIPARPASPLRGELSSTWSFPRSKSAPAAAVTESAHQKHRSTDRFFNCLDESDATDDSAPTTPISFNYEQSKDMFARGFQFAAEDDSPFFFPPGVGTIVDEPVVETKASNGFLMPLAEVEEEEDEDEAIEEQDLEDDTAIFGEEFGGIRITFTPPDIEEPAEEPEQIQLVSPAKPVSNPPVLPDLNFGFGADEDENFMFGLPTPTAKSSSPPSSSAVSTDFLTESPVRMVMPPTPPASLPRSASPRLASPSSIPRPVPRQSSTSLTDSPSPKSSPAVPFPIYTSPPNKRSFIPQPVCSPSAIRSTTSLRSKTPVSAPTFIRPPSTRIMPASSNTQSSTRSSNGSTFTPQPPLNRTSY
ncbi:hypothetical protein BKA70DRAFT_1093909 [Coprinopsis sp. MPI-PUGE-AT-0042]|nr:hypothetical protein BKA70DRAFT_1093909 [Coprinopsis sp. MPI-PUGE-AT-0042]